MRDCFGPMTWQLAVQQKYFFFHSCPKLKAAVLPSRFPVLQKTSQMFFPGKLLADWLLRQYNFMSEDLEQIQVSITDNNTNI